MQREEVCVFRWQHVAAHFKVYRYLGNAVQN